VVNYCIPGVGLLTAGTLIAELGVNMSVFQMRRMWSTGASLAMKKAMIAEAANC
jgi:hypothetical protein